MSWFSTFNTPNWGTARWNLDDFEWMLTLLHWGSHILGESYDFLAWHCGRTPQDRKDRKVPPVCLRTLRYSITPYHTTHLSTMILSNIIETRIWFAGLFVPQRSTTENLWFAGQLCLPWSFLVLNCPLSKHTPNPMPDPMVSNLMFSMFDGQKSTRLSMC